MHAHVLRSYGITMKLEGFLCGYSLSTTWALGIKSQDIRLCGKCHYLLSPSFLSCFYCSCLRNHMLYFFLESKSKEMSYHPKNIARNYDIIKHIKIILKSYVSFTYLPVSIPIVQLQIFKLYFT